MKKCMSVFLLVVILICSVVISVGAEEYRYDIEFGSEKDIYVGYARFLAIH